MTPEPHQNRRAILAQALGLLATGSLLGSCTTSRRSPSAALPGPVWPHENVTESPAPVADSSRARPTLPTKARFSVHARNEWTRAQPNVPDTNPMVRVEHITVHHDGMPPTVIRTQQEAAERLEMIRVSHVEHRGWADIGYHLIVDPQGRVWLGRPIHLQGAHVRDHNPRNLGVLVMGNFEIERPTPQATRTLDALLAHQSRTHGVPLNRIHTHREWASTACPGRSLQAHMDATRSSSGNLRNMLVRV
ncbi:MAG: N-acetylmuramoyl-L-alanine amidase [Phycisphaera sp.]|nr:MAG: N-acetylmuramoyl-L-alanine amidase [Phycisphaera sp.]